MRYRIKRLSMKKGFILFRLCIICFLCLSTTTLEAQQRVYVRMKPERQVVILRPAAPKPDYVWIDDEWVWDTKVKQYVVIEGHWTEPKKGKLWLPGHWRDSRRGSYWIEGHWGRI